MNRVVITGRGAVSTFGLGVEKLTEAVRQGRSGVVFIKEWEQVRGLNSFLAAPVPPLDIKKLLPRSVRRTMGDMAIYATLAAVEAVDDAGLDREFLESGQTGAAIGSTTGSPGVYEEYYRNFLDKESFQELRSGTFFKIMGHSCSANVCHALKIRGEQWATAGACSSSSQAIGLGYLLIKSGRQRAMICGGADEVHHSVTMIFDILKAASRNHDPPLHTPAPFDADRDGVVCSGGSGILVLESLESAQARNAEIYAEILGFGHVTDSDHIANPTEDAMFTAMNQAMLEAGVIKEKIDYINAHATGTEHGDITEARAISRVCGGADVPVSSLKGHLGHALGAAGSLETILVLEMFNRQELLPTLHLKRPDPACRGINLLQKKQKARVNTVLKNNFALGGVNTALVLRRWTHDNG